MTRRASLFFIGAGLLISIRAFVLLQGSVNVTASNTDALIVDQDNNGQADAGDVIRYTVEIVNCGPETALGGRYSSDIDPHAQLVPSSVQVGALAAADTSPCQSPPSN